MKNPKVKAFILQLICFIILFISFKLLIDKYTNLTGIWISLTSFVIVTIIGPKFQAVNTNNGEKLYMKWIFIKGIREIK
jgi:hypothetical protein